MINKNNEKFIFEQAQHEQITLLKRKKLIGAIGAIFGIFMVFLSIEPLFIELVTEKLPNMNMSLFKNLFMGFGLVMEFMGILIFFISR